LLKTLWVYLGLSLLLLILPMRWLQPLRGAALWPFSLAQRLLFEGTAPIEEFPDRVARLWGRAGREQELEREVLKLRAQLAGEGERRRSAEARLAQMDCLTSELQRRSIPARVIGYDASPVRSSILLDRGSGQGVPRGAGVLCNGALAGMIATLTPWSARALLLDDPACKVMVRCERSRVMGVLEGAGGGTCLVKYIPTNADLLPGDLFVTSGMDSLPDGVLVGVCTEAGGDFGEPLKWVTVRPSVDASQLEHVAVVIKAAAREGGN